MNRTLALSVLISAFLFAACQKNVDPVENKPPVVFAGIDTTYHLESALDTIRLSGSATDDQEVTGYSWTQISGPNTALIYYTGAASTPVSGLMEGSYIFQLMATDNKGATGVRTIAITVVMPRLFTMVLQPSPNPDEVHLAVVGSDNISDPSATEFGAMAWTSNGEPYIGRTLLRFDWSQLPPGGKIISAKLSLFSVPVPKNGNKADANFGTNNAMVLQRLTSSWSGDATWQNQPTATSMNELVIPHTNQPVLDLLDIDVTSLIDSMEPGANYGFRLKLQNETSYNSRIFCSSKYVDTRKHPRLVIEYSK